MGLPIGAIPHHDRPRERLLRLGADALSDRELVAILIGSGRPGCSALDVAEKALVEFGGVSGLARARPEELRRLRGIGEARAAMLAAALALARRVGGPDVGAALKRPEDVAAVVLPVLAAERRERVVALVCDTRNRLVRVVSIGEGSLDRSAVPVREVLNAVLRHDGRAFAVAHNHPSGDPTPSLSDHEATQSLQAGAAAAGLRFLGHIVVAGAEWREVTARR